jgi:hypothetical protein
MAVTGRPTRRGRFDKTIVLSNSYATPALRARSGSKYTFKKTKFDLLRGDE